MMLLAICGSLRTASSNLALLQATQLLAPAGVVVELYEGLAALPAFNPDEDGDHPPTEVAALRELVGRADGILISSPEYARGIAGSLKNALDWLVSSFEFPEIPVAVLNASPRATDADAALRLTLATMSARIVAEASITLPLMGRGLDAIRIAADPELARTLRAALAAMPRRVRL